VETGPVLDIFDRPKRAYTAALLKANPHSAKPGQPLPTVQDTLLEVKGERA
jgi:peptide/nickel transport system permease protein